MSLKRFLEVQVDAKTIESLRRKAKEKIEIEGWASKGRDADLKADNFARCWTSEIAWGQILQKENVKGKWAGLYVGDAEHAPPNYYMWFRGQKKTIGIRSRDIRALTRWKEVPYPNDRVRLEPERIHDFTIVSSIEFSPKGATVRFYGATEKERFLPVLQKTYRKLSRAQQEYFRPVPLRHFSYKLMLDLLKKADKIEGQENAGLLSRFF